MLGQLVMCQMLGNGTPPLVVSQEAWGNEKRAGQRDPHSKITGQVEIEEFE